MSLASKIDESFNHSWRAEILTSRPLILPRRHFTYPAIAEEVERGALEVMVSLANSDTFLATCALGFRDPAAPTGIRSTPNPDWLCALSGGYAYLINSENPTEFTMLELRPVLVVLAVPTAGLLLFIGNRQILAWGANGLAWQSDELSDEGITGARVEGQTLTARGWRMMRDEEFTFSINLQTGKAS